MTGDLPIEVATRVEDTRVEDTRVEDRGPMDTILLEDLLNQYKRTAHQLSLRIFLTSIR